MSGLSSYITSGRFFIDFPKLGPILASLLFVLPIALGLALNEKEYRKLFKQLREWEQEIERARRDH